MKRRIKRVVKTYSILIIIFISYYIIHKYTGFYIPCIFRQITGLKCPGCGITRCLFALLKLQIKKAFYYNPLVFILLPFITIYFIYESYLYIYDKKDKILIKIPMIFDILLLAITIIFGILRNIY